MFKWLVKKTIPAVQDWLESKEGQEYIHEVFDAEVDRQIARIRSSAGGVLHTPAGQGGQTLIGQLIQAVLPNIVNKALNSSPQSILPVEEKPPYG